MRVRMELATDASHTGIDRHLVEQRSRALDASGPLWPLALNGWIKPIQAEAFPDRPPGAAP